MAADAWEQAAQLKTAEEFRLLYVAMTRGKRLLWMSAAERGSFRWNTFSGKASDNLQVKKPCPILPALKSRFPEAVDNSFFQLDFPASILQENSVKMIVYDIELEQILQWKE